MSNMKYVYIQSKLSSCKRGDRIIVRCGDLYFIATVLKVVDGLVYLIRDDGCQLTLPHSGENLIGKSNAINRKFPKALTRKQAQQYLAEYYF